MKITPKQRNSIPFQYAQAVLDGKIVTGKYIKLAAQRFFDWIDKADEDGYYLDHNAGMKVIDFFPTFLKHTKGPLAKPPQPFVLSPFQQFTAYNIFAWKSSATGFRRINKVYDKQARKGGKTAFLAGLALEMQSFDGEASPEIYVGATKEMQAKTLWKQSVDFIKKSPALKKIGFEYYQREIRFTRNLGTFTFLGGDSKTLDSLNPSLAIIDEYHAHRDDSILEVLESAMGARTNPLVYIITTAGTNIYSVCKNAEDVFKEILEGKKKDDHTFIMIHDIDEDDDWEDEKVWEKANPNIRYNPPMLAHLRKEFIKAKNQPSKIPNFKTKHLNMWVDAPQIWIPNEYWKKNEVTDFVPYKTYEELFTAKALEFGCYAGGDLSTTKDLTSYCVMTNPDTEGNRYILSKNLCPANTIDIRSKEDGVPYRYWKDAGYLTATPGNSIDYDYLIDIVKDQTIKNKITRSGFDPHNARHLITILQDDGITVSEFAQGIMNMSLPSKMFEKLVLDGKLKHSGNPILGWALSGVVIYEDPNENIKLHKGQSHKGKKRIDPIVAAVIALGESMSEETETNNSIYNNPDVEISFGI